MEEIRKLPDDPRQFVDWTWEQMAPHFEALIEQQLTAETSADWMANWSRLAELVREAESRLYVAYSVDTTDESAEKRFLTFVDEVLPQFEEAEQRLREKLLANGFYPDGFERQGMQIEADSAIFHEDNLPLLTEQQKLVTVYEKLRGAQTIQWQGEELTLSQLQPLYAETDRALREEVWRLEVARSLEDREPINDLWVKLFNLRCRLAENAGRSDFRDYCWQQLYRFDYRPEDCFRFHEAIEEVVVPAARRLRERRRRQMGVERLRPWDLDVDPLGRPALKPFKDADILADKATGIFRQLDPQLGEYFAIMQEENLLDLPNRKGKAPGGYCTDFAASGRPFIFMNAVGVERDVQTILHEAGHAFHTFSTVALPFYQQRHIVDEFSEVASMSMELLAFPYLLAEKGGFYDEADWRRHQLKNLEDNILFWPYMAVVDAFQHWAYTNPVEAADPAECDACWSRLWQRFMVGEDWSGFEDEMATGWQRRLHIFTDPFYYIEYGLAQLGAIQVWANAQRNQAEAIASYRQALAMGGTGSLPELYAAAGARFAFDSETVGEAVALLEETIAGLAD